ncbi:antiporter, partial [Pseudomonas protegens]|nr:antiporter [Pseudomonas protegens]
IAAGTDTWIQNAGWVWLLFLVPLAFAGWFGMNNLLVISPTPGYPLNAFGKILGLYAVAFVAAAVGLYLYLPAPTGLGVLNMWGVM